MKKHEKLVLFVQILNILAVFFAAGTFFYTINDRRYDAKSYIENFDEIEIKNNSRTTSYGRIIDCDVRKYRNVTISFINKGGRTIYLDKFNCIKSAGKIELCAKYDLNIEVPVGKKVKKTYNLDISSLEFGDKIEMEYTDTFGRKYIIDSVLFTE